MLRASSKYKTPQRFTSIDCLHKEPCSSLSLWPAVTPPSKSRTTLRFMISINRNSSTSTAVFIRLERIRIQYEWRSVDASLLTRFWIKLPTNLDVTRDEDLRGKKRRGGLQSFNRRNTLYQEKEEWSVSHTRDRGWTFFTTEQSGFLYITSPSPSNASKFKKYCITPFSGSGELAVSALRSAEIGVESAERALYAAQTIRVAYAELFHKLIVGQSHPPGNVICTIQLQYPVSKVRIHHFLCIS